MGMKLNYSLPKHQAHLFSRQAILPNFLPIQSKLLGINILIIGAGGLGIPATTYLARMGAKILLMDHDRIEMHNLPRQVLFSEGDIGKFKSKIVANFLNKNNTYNKVEYETSKFSNANSEKISSFDLVIDCTDCVDTRYLISDTCKKYNKPFVMASVLGWEGQIYSFKSNGACYRCMYPVKIANKRNCDEAGVVSSMCGVIGSMAVNEVVKVVESLVFMDDIYKKENKIKGYEAYFYFDGRSNEIIKSRMRERNPECLACFPDIENKDSKNTKCENITNIDENSIKYITWTQTRDLHKNDEIIILDVRPALLFEYINIEGSINIPLTMLRTNPDVLKNFDNKKVAILCKRGISAKRAAFILAEKGADVFVIKGGLSKFEELDPDYKFF